MGVFSKAKKYSKSSLELEEKIKLLEKEEKKNIKEVTMSTAGMYSIVEPVPEVPPVDPTYDDVPDSNNWADGGTQTVDGGDPNDSATWDTGWNNTTDMFNPNELTGQTNRPIPVTPDLSGWAGGYVSSQNLGSGGYCGVAAWTISSGIGGGLAIGTIDSTNHFIQILVPDNIFSSYNYPADQSSWMTGGYYGTYNDNEFAAAQNIAVAYEGNKANGSVARDVWVNYDTATSHGGPSYAEYTGVKKQTTRPDGQPLYWKLKTISVLKGGNSYEKTPFVPHIPAWNRVLQTNALGDGNDPENFPGAIEVSGRLFKKSKEAIATMLEDDPKLASFPKVYSDADTSLGVQDGDLISWGGGGKSAEEKNLDKKFKAFTNTANYNTKNRGDKAAAMLEYGHGSEENFIKNYGITSSEWKDPANWLPDFKPNPDGPAWNKYKKKNEKYEPKGNLIEKVTYDFDKDPLVKKSDAFGNKEGQKTWFKAKDIKPEYPKKKAPKLKNGWHPKSPWNQMSERAQKIKVTSHDLLRQYKVHPKEIKEYHLVVDAINNFIDTRPEEAAVIAERYPFSDPRVAELNFKLDRMMDASEKYVESKFPENKKTTSRIVQIMKKNIELTDPKTFKMDPTPPTQVDYNKLKLRESATRHFKKPVQLKSWHKGHLTNA